MPRLAFESNFERPRVCFSSRDGLEWLIERRTVATGRTTVEVFLTLDRNLLFQQNAAKFNLAVIVLEAQSSRLSDMLPLISEVLVPFETIQVNEVVRISSSG